MLQLKNIGHTMREVDGSLGNVNVILRLKDGTYYALADNRLPGEIDGN